MKKSLIALTLAAAMCAPMIAQADGADFDTTSRIYLNQAMKCNQQARYGNAPVPCFRAAAYQKQLTNMLKGGYNVYEDGMKRFKLGNEYVAKAVRKIKGQ